MPTRYTLLFNMNTAPDVKTDANSHAGGWSESFWVAGNLLASDAKVGLLNAKRNLILPKQASIIGYRIASYTAAGNRMIPTGSVSGKLLLGGNNAWDTDVPQMSLLFFGKSAQRNTSKFALACIPDNQVSFGEYQPTPAFKGQVTQITNTLVMGQWGFIGRDLAQPALRIIKIVGSVVTLSGPAGGAAGTDYLIFNHCHDDAGNAVKGSFLITLIAGNDYTLAGFTGHNLSVPSGTARIDKPSFIPFTEVETNRIKIRKVGRPFELYHGRVSKR